MMVARGSLRKEIGMKIDCVDQLPFAADTVFEHA
jgi:hypothetical protein